MDREDESQGRMEEIYRQLPSAYSQFPVCLQELPMTDEEGSSCQISEARGLLLFELNGLNLISVI